MERRVGILGCGRVFWEGVLERESGIVFSRKIVLRVNRRWCFSPPACGYFDLKDVT